MDLNLPSHSEPVRTVSGSYIVLDEMAVLKWGIPGTHTAKKVGEQAVWLSEHEEVFLPKVHHVWDNAYTMERLVPLPAFVLHESLTREIFQRLRLLWNVPVEPRCSFDDHLVYLEGRDAKDALLDWGLALRSVLTRLPEVVTHGDPTWDNCMLNMQGKLVLTDPVQNPRLPSVRAMDVGKVIQSYLGYERIIYTQDIAPLPNLKYLRKTLRHITDAEWQACLYFAAVHYTLLQRYTPTFQGSWNFRINFLLLLRDDTCIQSS